MNGAAKSELSAEVGHHGADAGLASRVPRAFLDRVRDRLSLATRRWREAQGRDRGDHREEAQGVDRERPLEAADVDHDAGERRADDAPEVPLRRAERDGAGELLPRDEVGHERLVRREAEGAGATRRQHDQRDGPRWRRIAGREGREDRGEGGLHGDRAEEQAASRDAVGERAAERTEDRVRDEPGRCDQTRPSRPGPSGS